MKIKQLMIPRTSNDIQELLISYGLFSILLDMNYDFDVTLKRKKGAYIIDLDEEIETEDIVVIPTEMDTDIENLKFNGMVNKSEFNAQIKNMFGTPDDFGDYIGGFLTSEDNTLSNIFSYYATLEDEYIINFKNKDGMYINGIYTGKGVRDFKQPKGIILRAHECYLSMLGYYRSTSFVSLANNDNEITWLSVPSSKGINYLNKWHPYMYVDKETGEIIPSYYLGSTGVSVTTALLKVKLQLEISILESIDGFDGYYEFQVAPTRNKPLNDKVQFISWLKGSEGLLSTLNKQLSYTTKEYDLKESIGFFTNKISNQNFTNMVNNLIKSGFNVFTINEIEEICKMVNKNELLEVQAIQDYAKMIRRFMIKFKGDGYNAQKNLMSANNETKLLAALSQMNVMYFRRYAMYRVKESSLKELFTDILGSGQYSVKDVVNAILLLSTVKGEKAPEDSVEVATGEVIVEEEAIKDLEETETV